MFTTPRTSVPAVVSPASAALRDAEAKFGLPRHVPRHHPQQARQIKAFAPLTREIYSLHLETTEVLIMTETVDPDETEDETGTIGPESVYAGVVEDTQPLPANDIGAWDEDTELDDEVSGLA